MINISLVSRPERVCACVGCVCDYAMIWIMTWKKKKIKKTHEILQLGVSTENFVGHMTMSIKSTWVLK